MVQNQKSENHDTMHIEQRYLIADCLLDHIEPVLHFIIYPVIFRRIYILIRISAASTLHFDILSFPSYPATQFAEPPGQDKQPTERQHLSALSSHRQEKV